MKRHLLLRAAPTTLPLRTACAQSQHPPSSAVAIGDWIDVAGGSAAPGGLVQPAVHVAITLA